MRASALGIHIGIVPTFTDNWKRQVAAIEVAERVERE